MKLWDNLKFGVRAAMLTIEGQTPGVHEAGGLVPDHLSRLQQDVVLSPAVVPDLQRPGRVDLGKSHIREVDMGQDNGQAVAIRMRGWPPPGRC